MFFSVIFPVYAWMLQDYFTHNIHNHFYIIAGNNEILYYSGLWGYINRPSYVKHSPITCLIVTTLPSTYVLHIAIYDITNFNKFRKHIVEDTYHYVLQWRMCNYVPTTRQFSEKGPIFCFQSCTQSRQYGSCQIHLTHRNDRNLNRC